MLRRLVSISRNLVYCISNALIDKIREFKICDAKVTKTSFKIGSSGLLIFFVIMSACLTSTN